MKAALLTVIALSCMSWCRAEVPELTESDIYNPESLCYEIAGQINSGNQSYVVSRVDMEAFAKRGPASNNLEVHDMIASLGPHIFDQINQSLAKRHMHVSAYRREGPEHLCVISDTLQTAVDPTANFMSIEFVLVDSVSGPHIVDVRPLWEPFAVGVTLAKLLQDGIPADAYKHPNKRVEYTPLMTFVKAIQHSDGAAIKSSFASLPLAQSGQAFYLSQLIYKLYQLNDPALPDYYSSLAQAAGDDPRYGLLLIDYYERQKDWAHVNATLVNLRQTLDNDVAVCFLAMNAAYLRNEYSEYIQQGLQALDENPSLQSTYWLLLLHLAKIKDYDRALLVANVMHQKFHLSLSPLRSSNDAGVKNALGEFANSPVFLDWLSKHPDYSTAKKTEGSVNHSP